MRVVSPIHKCANVSDAFYLKIVDKTKLTSSRLNYLLSTANSCSQHINYNKLLKASTISFRTKSLASVRRVNTIQHMYICLLLLSKEKLRFFQFISIFLCSFLTFSMSISFVHFFTLCFYFKFKCFCFCLYTFCEWFSQNGNKNLCMWTKIALNMCTTVQFNEQGQPKSVWKTIQYETLFADVPEYFIQ